MKKPAHVPEGWVPGICINCQEICFYDPSVERATLDIGKKFYATCGAKCAVDLTKRLALTIENEPPLQINQRIHLTQYHWAYFDGTFIVIDNPLGVRVRLTPVMMAHLFYLNRRVVDTFPEQWAIRLEDLEDE